MVATVPCIGLEIATVKIHEAFLKASEQISMTVLIYCMSLNLREKLGHNIEKYSLISLINKEQGQKELD